MWTIKHHEDFEKQICAKCPADINKDYTPCAKCRRAQDFEAGYKTGFRACAKKRLNATTISDCPIKDDQLTKAKELLAKWVELFKPKLEGYPITPIQEQTEQFLKEVTK